MDKHIEVKVIQLEGGIAPPNDFDRKLAAALRKEEEELERLKAGRDGLASRVRDLEE